MPSMLPQHLVRHTSRFVGRTDLLVHRSWFVHHIKGPRVTERLIHVSQASKTYRDQSTIDFAYFPQEAVQDSADTLVIRVPILPNNYSERNNVSHHEPLVESVRRPEIFTVSANGTHIDNPSAMSDVVDNHAADIDHFGLTKHVTNAACKVTKIGTEQIEKQGSVMRNFWAGLMDDIFGERKAAHI